MLIISLGRIISKSLENLKNSGKEGFELILWKLARAYSAAAGILIITSSLIIFSVTSALIITVALLYGENTTTALMAFASALWAIPATTLYKLNQERLDSSFWNRIIFNNLCKDRIQVTVTLQDNAQLTGKLHLTTDPNIVIIENRQTRKTT